MFADLVESRSFAAAFLKSCYEEITVKKIVGASVVINATTIANQKEMKRSIRKTAISSFFRGKERNPPKTANPSFVGLNLLRLPQRAKHHPQFSSSLCDYSPMKFYLGSIVQNVARYPLRTGLNPIAYATKG